MFPPDFEDRVIVIEPEDFVDREFDFFCDGIVRLRELDGHHEGHMGMHLVCKDSERLFVGDATWDKHELSSEFSASLGYEIDST